MLRYVARFSTKRICAKVSGTISQSASVRLTTNLINEPGGRGGGEGGGGEGGGEGGVEGGGDGGGGDSGGGEGGGGGGGGGDGGGDGGGGLGGGEGGGSAAMTIRMLWSPSPPATYRIAESDLSAIWSGYLKVADPDAPSSLPALPVPATVLTTPVPVRADRILLLE